MQSRSRRRFVKEVGFGMLAASVGPALVADMGLASMPRLDDERLDFGTLEPLVALMQETPIHRFLHALKEKLQAGESLRTLVAAAALANARTFGGEDYIGFHTMMALAPAFRMSTQLPTERAALPVFKVLYRNTQRIHDFGGKDREVLKKIDSSSISDENNVGKLTQHLHQAVRDRNVELSERYFAKLAAVSSNSSDVLCGALSCVEDETEVHRVALPYRAFDLLDIVGMEHAHSMLRQSIRYCVQAGLMNHGADSESPATLLPKLFDQYHLDRPIHITKQVDAAWVRQLATTIFSGTAVQAADAVAAAISEGIDMTAIGQSLTLASNQLVLRDRGRTPREESLGKPLGSVHGDSIGVHATDSANAWRNLASHADAKHRAACLVLGGYQVAYDRVARGGDFLHWDALPVHSQLDRIQESDPTILLQQLDEAVCNNLQAQASAIAARYGALQHAPELLFDCLLKYAISEDGALHAEKYYQTVREEFQNAHPEHRWEFATSLARVTSSEFGRPAAGYAESVELLRG